jgi:PAS domain S-box-containing protein
MTVIVMLDWLTVAGIAAGFAGALRVSARRIGLAAKTLLLLTLFLYLFVASSNVLEHSKITSALDSYEDYAEILFFPFALFFVYAAWTRLESDRRLAAELNLCERERTLSTLLGNLPGMAYRCRNDRDWTVEFVSGGCAALTGYKPADLIGNRVRSYADLIVEDDRERVWETVQWAVERGEPFRLEYRIRQASGRERWVWEQGIGVHSEGGQLEALEGFITDITKRKQAEHELDLYRRHLESLVQRRTEQLQAAQARLEESLETLRADEEAGKIIQFKLLPEEVSVIGGYRFNRRLIPSMYLSGDFMDCFAVDDRRVAFYMADVSGHGVSSAFVTVLLKSIVRNCLENFRAGNDDLITDPAALLSRLNDEVLRANLEKHMTIFYGLLDGRKNDLTFASAGQFPYPILYRKGAPEMLSVTAPPVGLFDFARYENQAEDLTDDFVLFMFSDGVLEVLSEDSLSRKVAFIAAQGAQDDFDVEKLCADLGLDPAETFPDDIAFLTVRRTDGGGR